MLGLNEVLQCLHQALHSGAHLANDYPITLFPTAEGVIFPGSVGQLASAEFLYAQHEQRGDTHEMWLKYRLQRRNDASCVSTPASFDAPGLGDLLAAAHQAGFSCFTGHKPHTTFFLPGEMALINFRRI